MIDVADAFDPEFMQPATRKRGTRSFAVGGEGEITTSYANTSIQVSLQPSDLDDEIPALRAEGQRKSGAVFEIYSTTELRVDDGENGLADVVVVGARRFKVVHVFDWTGHGYCRAVAVEIA